MLIAVFTTEMVILHKYVFIIIFIIIIDYSHAKNLRDKWQAETKMIKAINKLPGNKTLTEKIVKRIMQAKKKLKL